MKSQIHNKNIEEEVTITTPIKLRGKIPLSDNGADNILTSRKTIDDIFLKKDSRLIVIVGPCSIHHIGAAKEYESLEAELATLCRKFINCIKHIEHIERIIDKFPWLFS